MSDRTAFSSWFYDAKFETTSLWRELENLARITAPPRFSRPELVDGFVADLSRRLRNNAADFFPVPVRTYPSLIEQPDYLDVLRFCRAAVRNRARSLWPKGPQPLQLGDGDWLDGRVGGDTRVLGGNRAFPGDPTAGAVVDYLTSERDLDCWRRLLVSVADTMGGERRLPHPDFRAASLAFLRTLSAFDPDGPRDESEGDTDDRRGIVWAASRSVIALVDPIAGGERPERTFHEQFHHAFWRTVSFLVAAEDWKALRLTPEYQRLAGLAGEDSRRFLVAFHDASLASAPLPFTPRRAFNGVNKWALISRLRETLWLSAIRVECPDADPWPPPTPFVLHEVAEND